MARISTYAVDNTIAPNDKLIGTDADDSDLTKNYKVSDLSNYIVSQVPIYTLEMSSVLSGLSTSDQIPSGLDTALQVSFGSAQTTTPVSIDAAGTITFNEQHLYIVNLAFRVGRTSVGAVSYFAIRDLYNGTQSLPTRVIQVSSVNDATPYEISIPYYPSVGDTLSWEAMRDSAGFDAGGLFRQALSGGWSAAPSASINIYKVEI
jgi:hypothetical protein